MSLPNILTFARLILWPLLLLLYQAKRYELFFSLFVLLAITDALDGFLARRWNQLSTWGALWDPIADKLLVVTVLVLLVQHFASFQCTVVALILIAREILVGILRQNSLQTGQMIAVSWLGKAKTFFQMLALGILSYSFLGLPVYWVQIGFTCLWFSAVLSIVSLMDYLKQAL